MRPVSPDFQRTVKSSHTMVVRATVCQTYQTGVQPTGYAIGVLDGDVSLDGTAKIRSTLDFTTPGRVDEDNGNRWPRSAGSFLAPYGNEIYVERGIEYGNGRREWVGLGYHRIQTPSQRNPPDGPIRITALDRMAGIIDARLLSPRQYIQYMPVGDVVQDLIKDVYPAAVIEWDDATPAVALDRAMIAEDDRHKFLDELIRSYGKIWYWDHRGVLVIKAAPDPATPVLRVSAGRDGVLVDMSRELTRDGVYNVVVASGEGADTTNPVRGIAWDDNPASPTYYFGRFGPVPKFFTSAAIVSDGQAAVVAEAELRRNLGLPYSVDLSTVPNPALEPWDPIMVRPDEASDWELHVIASLKVPLTPGGEMTIATREQTSVLVGIRI